METNSLLEAMVEKAQAEGKAATLRAGLIAAAVYNVNRKKGAYFLQPKDFLDEPPVLLDPETMEIHLDAWARTANKEFKA